MIINNELIILVDERKKENKANIFSPSDFHPPVRDKKTIPDQEDKMALEVQDEDAKKTEGWE